MGYVVFRNMYFQSLILQQLCDKLQLSWLAKLSFKLTNIIYLRLAAQFKQDKKTICLFPLTTIQIFSEIRSNGLEVEGRDFGTLLTTTDMLLKCYKNPFKLFVGRLSKWSATAFSSHSEKDFWGLICFIYNIVSNNTNSWLHWIVICLITLNAQAF